MLPTSRMLCTELTVASNHAMTPRQVSVDGAKGATVSMCSRHLIMVAFGTQMQDMTGGTLANLALATRE